MEQERTRIKRITHQFPALDHWFKQSRKFPKLITMCEHAAISRSPSALTSLRVWRTPSSVVISPHCRLNRSDKVTRSSQRQLIIRLAPFAFPRQASTMAKPYQPIDCGVYDQLEVLAMRRTVCQIEYSGTKGIRETIESPIVDVFAKSGEEFITLQDGQQIRLDRLLRLNGKPMNGTCGVSDKE